MIFSSPPQFGQCSRSISNTRLSNRAQLMRTWRPCAHPGSVAVCSDLPVACLGPCGTTSVLSLASGASTPWKRIRCSRGRGTSALSSLGERGLKAGTDFALMGFDNVLDAEHSNPPLSTIDVGPEDLGERVAAMLLARLQVSELPRQRYLAVPQLVLRQSA